MIKIWLAFLPNKRVGIFGALLNLVRFLYLYGCAKNNLRTLNLLLLITILTNENKYK